MAHARRIGILGGAFDPIHNGHLAIARLARQYCALDTILYVPAYCPPHKQRVALAPFEHRCRMIELALHADPAATLSSIECSGTCPSYIGDTIKRITRDMGLDDAPFLITGADALLTMIDRHKCHIAPRMVRFVVIGRPGTDLAALRRCIPPAYRDDMRFTDAAGPDISSHAIRDLARANGPFERFVPAEVCAYIRQFGIYRRCFT